MWDLFNLDHSADFAYDLGGTSFENRLASFACFDSSLSIQPSEGSLMSVHREIFQIVNRFLRKRKAFPDSNGARRRMLSVEPLEERRLLATIDLANLGVSQGSIIFGADASDDSGFSVSNAGDVNGEGFDDLIIGAFNAGAANNSKVFAGESYLIYGGNFTTSVTHL